MKAFLRDFGITIMLALALLVCGLLTSCAPGQPPERVGVSSASLVTLMRLVPATPASALETGRMRDSYEPHCTAFAVARLERVQLATAAHCVRDVQAIRYVPPSGWGLGTARVQYISEARDVAFLDVDPDGLVPLEIGPTPGTGERVRAFSSVYDATSTGRVQAHYDGGWYETSQTIVYGWSGSPEVDTAGRAVGVVAKCPTVLAGTCMPGVALVTSLR